MVKTATELAKKESSPLTFQYTPEQVELVKRTVCKGATNDELALFLHTAKRTGLDPLTKQLFAVKRKSKDGIQTMAIQTGIDGYRLIAARTGEHAGTDDVVYDSDTALNPTWAKVTVYRLVQGTRVPFAATARWKEYYPKPPNDFMWNKMPYLMLGKVAEALALRKAFPAELSSLYTNEEMDQAGATTEARVVEKPKPTTEEDKIQMILRAADAETRVEELEKLYSKLETSDKYSEAAKKEFLPFIMARITTLRQGSKTTPGASTAKMSDADRRKLPATNPDALPPDDFLLP